MNPPVLPPFYSLLLMAIFIPQIVGALVSDFMRRSLPMFIEPWLFLLLTFFASLGFAGAIFLVVYAVSLGYRRWTSGREVVQPAKRIWKPGEGE